MPTTDPILALLSATLPEARTLEQLTRPLLRLLSQVSGMESTYLTTVHVSEGVQRVELSCNCADLEIPEGLVVPWGDTLCKRALDENLLFCNNVSEYWGDSSAAQALNIQSYASAPIYSADGSLLGTVCGASTSVLEYSPELEALLPIISGVLGIFLERETLLERLQQMNGDLKTLALTDTLTGLANRRAVLAELKRLFALAKREEKCILVAVIDLDGFKQINDMYGHLVGDAFLSAISERFKQELRGSDIIGRFGGDEFLLGALGPASDTSQEQLNESVQWLQQRLHQVTAGRYQIGGLGELNYVGASVGVVAVANSVSIDEAIRMADAEMYRIKRMRKQPQ